ncbi:MAG: transketolase [Roseburia sp.]
MHEHELEEISLKTRQKIFEIVCKNRAGHLASSLSSVEILTALYFGNILRYDAKNPQWEDRDRFVLSKGHSAIGYYITLAKAGYFKEEEVNSFCIAGTRYGGLPLKDKVGGVEATTGSLGHGLSYAAGMAMNAKIFQKDYKVYVLLGDGELQEGSVWEAAMFIAQHELKNIEIIIDYNKIQATGRCKDIINIEPLREKWQAFGFDVLEADGHNVCELVEKMGINEHSAKPRVLIAHTVKGKGLSFAENNPDWHYKMPTEEQIEIGLRELGMKGR